MLQVVHAWAYKFKQTHLVSSFEGLSYFQTGFLSLSHGFPLGGTLIRLSEETESVCLSWVCVIGKLLISENEEDKT